MLLAADVVPKGTGDFMVEMMARGNLALDMTNPNVVYARVR